MKRNGTSYVQQLRHSKVRLGLEDDKFENAAETYSTGDGGLFNEREEVQLYKLDSIDDGWTIGYRQNISGYKYTFLRRLLILMHLLQLDFPKNLSLVLLS
jgi:hypothetical protein